MNENIVMAEKKPKLWLAILVAIGMGLAGCLLWGLLYYVGYIAWIAAYVVVLASAWGYKKFNLKMDTKGYIIISVIAVVEIILTMFITINIACMIEFSKQGLDIGFFDSFNLMFRVIGADAQAKSSIIIDAVLSLIFIVVGILTFFFVERRKERMENTTKAVNDSSNDTIVKLEQPVEDNQKEKEEKDK